MNRDSWRFGLLLLAVLTLATYLRFQHLGTPPAYVFDEFHYLPSVQALAKGMPDPELHHPPLAKIQMVILSFIVPGGDDWESFRGATATVGILSLAIFALLTREVSGSAATGLLACLLLSIDGLHLTFSRAVLLDVHLLLWTLLAWWAVWRLQAEASWPALAFCGVLFGAAMACKWNGLFHLFGATIFLLSQWPRKAWPRILTLWLAAPATYLAISLLVLWPHFGFDPMRLAEQHQTVLKFRQQLWSHSQKSFALWWPLGIHPVGMSYIAVRGQARAILSVGLIPLWWVGSIVMLATLNQAWRLKNPLDIYLSCWFFLSWLPWFLNPTSGLSYYFLTSLPPLVMATAWTFSHWWQKGRFLVVGLAGLVFALFWLTLLPLNLGWSYPDHQLEQWLTRLGWW